MGIGWTLRARGLGPSLGAGGSLVVAVLCCLIFATGLLTFRDWPGQGEGSPDGTVTMTVPAGKAAGRSATGPDPAIARARTTRGAAMRPGRGAARRRAASAPRAPRSTNRPTAPAPVAAPSPAAPQPGAAAPAPGGQQPAAAPQAAAPPQ